MEHFKLMQSSISRDGFVAEIDAVPGAWEIATGRQEQIAVQREARSIPLRGLRASAINGRRRRDVHESRWTTGSMKFPYACAFIKQFSESQDAEPGRAKIVLLPAGRRVYPHIDRGEYYRLHDRYHLVLKSALGSWLKAGEDTVRMQEGELWWFDNSQVHEAMNDGTEDRIHIIFDLLPRARAGEAFGPSAIAA